MAEVLLDSSIVIDYLRGSPHADGYIAQLRHSGAPLTHPVVQAELLQGAFDRAEQATIQNFFAACTTVMMSEIDVRQSLALLTRYRLSHGVGWHDCLIAATCIRVGISVATLNIRHFRMMPGLNVLRPY